MPTNFTYTQNIPLATNKPSVDQPNMKTNTNSVNSILSVDHLSFGQATGVLSDGYHKAIHLANQASDPAAVLTTTEIYSKQVTFNSVSDTALFARSGSGTITQLTAPNSISTATNGFVFLPGGIILQWGRRSTNFSSGSTIGTETFPVAFLNSVLSVTGNPLMNYTPVGNRPNSQGSLNIRASSLANLTTFDWQFYTNSSDYKGFDWIAIGF